MVKNQKGVAPVPQIVVITGPTAVGKTNLAIGLARRFPVSLISVDSGQVYRELDIGTAKPDGHVLREFPHAMINLRSVREPYSVSEYCWKASEVIRQSIAAGQIPLLVGGAMFYLSSLLNGLVDLPPADASLRQALSRQGRAIGWQAMHKTLSSIDPQAAARINPHDQQRIQRALEINHLTGRRISSNSSRTTFLPEGVRVCRLVASMTDREELHQRIAVRFDQMIDRGLIEEVSVLMNDSTVGEEFPAMKNVGYRQVWQYLDGRMDRSTMREQAIAASRKLAKRQLTWLRNTSGNVWLDAAQPGLLDTVARYLHQLMPQI